MIFLKPDVKKKPGEGVSAVIVLYDHYFSTLTCSLNFDR